MKNPLLLTVSALCAALFIVLAGAPAQAKIWRVDNNGGSPGNFTSIAAAFAAGSGVADNDTLYFNGSGTGYGDATITKRVYMFGPGYFLAQNPQTQASPTAATVGTLTFDPSASGSLLTGMSFGRVYVNADNVLIKRNYGTNSSNYPVVTVQTGRSNVLVVQNYLYNGYYERGVYVQGGCSNVLVANNFIGTNYNSSSTPYCAVYSESSLTVTQNVIYRSWIQANNSNITNNILREGGITGSGNGVLNNLGYNTDVPAGNGNQQNVDMSTVFLNSGSDDGYWLLKASSPALAAGANGEDCGMFGGTDPYVLSGLPAIPAIWFFSAPTSGSGASGLQVHLKAKSHN